MVGGSLPQRCRDDTPSLPLALLLCSHTLLSPVVRQAGKVLVSTREHIDRLVAARLQCDVLGVSTVLICRTDAEAATLLDSNVDERDHPFILGTRAAIPPLNQAMEEGLRRGLDATAMARLIQQWEVDARLCTLDAAVEAAILALPPARSEEAARRWGERRSSSHSTSHAATFAWCRQWLGGAAVQWDCEKPRTREGFYRMQGGVEAWSVQRPRSAATEQSSSTFHAAPPLRSLSTALTSSVCPLPVWPGL